jgi:S-layer protein
MAVSANDIQGLYIAYFNRPADYLGLQFWTKAANDKGGDINVVANAFASSSEYTTLYAGKSTAQIIDTIYMNLFGRHAELDGIKFWGAALDNKVLGIGNIAYQIMTGAQDTVGGFQDKTAVSSKISAATSFYNSLDTAEEVIAYSGDTANALVKTWLSTVVDQATLDTATSDAALAAITNSVVQSNVPVVPPQTITLTVSPDTVTGGTGNDIFNANYDIANSGQTLSPLDSIDGGAGTDTLNIVSTVAFTVDSSATVKNVEVAKIVSTATVDGDVSGWTGLTSLTVTEVGGTNAAAVTAAATTSVTLSDSNLANAAISVQGGKDVTVTAAKVGTGSAINVGTTTAVVGAVSVTANATAAVSQAASTVNVKGGTTVSVTESATNTGTTGTTTTQGAVGVTGTAVTTAVTVNQAAAVTAVANVAAIAGVTESNTVTFGALTAGETVILGGLTFTSTGATTAAQVAAAFASLANGATQGGSTALGTFSGTLTGWKTSGATGSAVTFTSSTANTNVADLANTGTSVAAQAVVKVADGSAATAAVASKGGIGLGAVTIADVNAGSTTKAATIASVTLANYGASTISSNALANLTLSGKSGSLGITSGLTTETVTTLNLNVNSLSGTGNTITDSSNHFKTIAVNTGTVGNSSIANIVDSAATALTVAGSKVLTLTSTAGLSALKTVTVTGAAGLSADVSGLTTVTDVNAAASSGANTVTLDATAATYEGGSGVDTVTILANPTKAISGGAGVDVLNVNIAGGFNASSNSLITGFETLGVGGLATGTYVATNFTHLTEGAVAGAITFSNVAAGTDLTITASPTAATTYTLADATGTADALAVKIAGTGASVGTNIAAGTLTASGIEKVTLAVSDSNGDAAGTYTDTLTLVDTAAKTITITGDTNLSLTVTGNIALTSIDASASTGGLTVTTAGTVAEVVKGGAGVNTLTAVAGATGDTLVGGASADKLVANAGLDTLTGGAGADTFVVATAGANVNTYTTITDIAKGDILQLANLGLETFGSTKVALAGTAVFQDYANAVVAAGGNASANAYIGWFQFGGDTYIVESLHNGTTTPSFTNGTDLVVKLTGLIDLAATASPAAFTNNGAGNTGVPQITFG